MVVASELEIPVGELEVGAATQPVIILSEEEALGKFDGGWGGGVFHMVGIDYIRFDRRMGGQRWL